MLTRVFLAAFAILFSAQTLATMQVERTVIHFEAGKANRQDVEVSNPTEEPIYIQVELLEVISPGTENEERKLVQNPREVNFLVTPNKLVLPPGGRKLIRFVNLAPLGDKEKVFRVNLKPVASHERDEEVTAIKVLIGYQLLVFLEPATPAVSVIGQVVGNKFSVENKGNTNVMLQRGVQCEDPKKKENCVELPAKRLYPGNKWSIDLQYATPVEYIVSSGLKNKSQVFSEPEPTADAATKEGDS